MNICSVVVHVKPKHVFSVQREIKKIPGVEIHGGAEAGKLILTIERGTDDALADTMSSFNDIRGVLNVVMIYHHCGEQIADQEVANNESIQA